MALNPKLREIADIVSRAIVERRKKINPAISKQYERLGMRTPQVAGMISNEKAAGDLQLADLEAQLLSQQYGEEREERLSDEEWERKLGLDRMDFNQQMTYLETQMQASAAENEKTRAYNTSERIAGEKYATDVSNAAAKSAKKSALTKLFLGLGLGAITGGVGTAAGLIGGGLAKGVGKAGANFGKIMGGAALGAVSGPSGATGLIGEGLKNKALIDWYKRYGNKFIGPKEESEQNITWLQ